MEDKRTTQTSDGKLKEPLGLDTEHPALSVVPVRRTVRTVIANRAFESFSPDGVGSEDAEFRTSVEALPLNVKSGNVSVQRLDRWSKRENAQRTTMAEGVVTKRTIRVECLTPITIVINVIDAGLALQRKPIG